MKFIHSARVACFHLVALSCFGWITFANASEAETIEKLDELVARGFLPHYQLSTVDSDGVRSYRAKAYVDGLVDITEPQPESLFAMLSLSKPFTNLLALKMVDSGRINLDDPIEMYLPELGTASEPGNGAPNSTTSNRKIIVRDLLLHTAGFAQNTELMGLGTIAERYQKDQIFGLHCLNGQEQQSLEAIISKLAAVPLQNAPGATFTYSIATDVLAALLETAAKQPFEKLITEELFLPIGMNNTGFTVPQDKHNNLLALYQPLVKTYPVPGDYQRYQPLSVFKQKSAKVGEQPGCISAGTGLVSSVKDMQIFLQFLLNDMHLESGQQYLTNDLLQSFLSHQLSSHLGTSPLSRSLPKTKGDGLSYGLAIHLQDGGLLTEPDTYDYLYWSGFSGSGFWFNADRTMGGIFVSQLFNSDQFLLPDIAENIRH